MYDSPKHLTISSMFKKKKKKKNSHADRLDVDSTNSKSHVLFSQLTTTFILQHTQSILVVLGQQELNSMLSNVLTQAGSIVRLG